MEREQKSVISVVFQNFVQRSMYRIVKLFA